MKHIKHINEINADYNHDKDEYEFNPSNNNIVTFYLHKGREGFTMKISKDDKDNLEKILKDNNINHTIEDNSDLPF